MIVESKREYKYKIYTFYLDREIYYINDNDILLLHFGGLILIAFQVAFSSLILIVPSVFVLSLLAYRSFPQLPPGMYLRISRSLIKTIQPVLVTQILITLLPIFRSAGISTSNSPTYVVDFVPRVRTPFESFILLLSSIIFVAVLKVMIKSCYLSSPLMLIDHPLLPDISAYQILRFSYNSPPATKEDLVILSS